MKFICEREEVTIENIMLDSGLTEQEILNMAEGKELININGWNYKIKTDKKRVRNRKPTAPNTIKENNQIVRRHKLEYVTKNFTDIEYQEQEELTKINHYYLEGKRISFLDLASLFGVSLLLTTRAIKGMQSVKYKDQQITVKRVEKKTSTRELKTPLIIKDRVLFDTGCKAVKKYYYADGEKVTVEELGERFNTYKSYVQRVLRHTKSININGVDILVKKSLRSEIYLHDISKDGKVTEGLTMKEVEEITGLSDNAINSIYKKGTYSRTGWKVLKKYLIKELEVANK